MHTFLSNSLPLLERLAQAHGLTLELPQARGRTRLPTEFFDDVCRRLARSSDDPAFGLQAARLWHPSDFGALGYAWFASATLRAALQRLVRYRRIVGERGELTLREAEEGLWLCYEHHRDDAELERIGTDIALSILLALCRRNHGPDLQLLAVHLRRPQPALSEAYTTLFGRPVVYDAPDNGLLLAHAAVDRELDTANQEVTNALDQILAQQLAALNEEDTVARCKAILLRTLASGLPSAHDIARQLCISERTLQRRLAESGSSFLALIDETRRDLAMGYLEDSHNSVTEVAFLVGFSTPSAFTRAFVRWTGQSPTHWRNTAQPAPRQAA